MQLMHHLHQPIGIYSLLCRLYFQEGNEPLFIIRQLRICADIIRTERADGFVSARRRREACRGTLTDDNAAMADSDKHNPRGNSIVLVIVV